MSSALRYSPVASEDSEEFSDKSFNVASTRDLPRNGSQCSALRQYVLLLITSLIFFAVGLTIGIQLSENPTSAGTHEAFDFLCGVGFVRHPEVSPELSGVAVFHELHCVNILRVGYYAALDGTLAEMQHVHDHNKRPDPHHLRHCFDYLRQALVCNADTNLEPVDFELGGVTGWKFDRKCRNFEAVKAWADEWRSWPEELEGM